MAGLSLNNLKQLQELGIIKKARRFRSGQVNESYHIKTSKGEYVLRIYRDKKEKEIAFETFLLDCLMGLPVPRIVLIGGKEIIKIGSSFAIVYTYIPGKNLQYITPQQRKSVGRVLANIHNRAKNFKWASARDEAYSFSEQKIRMFSRSVSNSTVPFKKRFQEIKGDVKTYALHAALPICPIHVDVKPENVLFYKGKVSGIIDFDNAYIGPRILDVAKTIVWFGLKGKQLSLAYVKDIYSGYTSAGKLTFAEHKALYKAIKFAYASHLFEGFYLMSTKKITKQYFGFLMDNLYSSYINFTASQQDFYKFL